MALPQEFMFSCPPGQQALRTAQYARRPDKRLALWEPRLAAALPAKRARLTHLASPRKPPRDSEHAPQARTHVCYPLHCHAHLATRD
jgi:hypothetical protein